MKNMKKISFVILLSTIGFFNLSMYWDPSFGILNQDDIDLAKDQEPALSSAIGQEPSWGSYAEWQCFPVNSIEVRYIKYCQPEGCSAQTDYDVPSISVQYGGHLYEFDYDFESELIRREETIQWWRNLVQNQSNICLYAAMLPTNIVDTGDPNQSFWTLYNVKTKNGIWKKENYPYLEDEGTTKAPTDL
jgi:hypothetical protein